MKKRAFPETEDYEYGFANHYEWNVLPEQEKLEKFRKKSLIAFSWRALCLLPTGYWLYLVTYSIVLLILQGGPENKGGWQSVFNVWCWAFGLFLFVFFYVFRFIYAYKVSMKTRVFHNAVKFFKGFSHLTEAEMSPLEFNKSKILPPYKSFCAEDQITGKFKGCTIKMAEVRLYKPMLLKPVFGWLVKIFITLYDYGHAALIEADRYHSWNLVKRSKNFYNFRMKAHDTTMSGLSSAADVYDDRIMERKVFNGLFISFDMPKKFYGTTIALKDHGVIGNYIRKNKIKYLRRVRLEDPELEKMFEFYSNSQIESRCILDPAFMSKLLDLSKTIHKRFRKGMTVSFFQNKCFIMIPCRENLFEPRSLFRSAVGVKDIKIFLKQMSLIFEIVDILKLNMEENEKRILAKINKNH